MGSSLSKKCSIAAVSVAVVAGTALLATPANSASNVLTYDCETSLGKQVFTVVVDTDAPATLAAGTTAPINATASVTVPASVIGPLRDFAGATHISGVADVNQLLDGTQSTNVLTIPKTAIPASGDMTLPAAGPAGNLTAGTAGQTHTLAAGDFLAKIVVHQNNGGQVPFEIPCTPQTVDDNGTPADTSDDTPLDQDLTVDTVSVVKAPAGTPTPTPTPTVKPTVTPTVTPVPAKSDTTTQVRAKYNKKSNKAKVKVVVKAVSGEASGSVKVTLKRGSKKVKSVSAKLVSGTAKVVFKKISRPGKYKVIAKYPGSSTTNASSGKDTFKVRR